MDALRDYRHLHGSAEPVDPELADFLRLEFPTGDGLPLLEEGIASLVAASRTRAHRLLRLLARARPEPGSPARRP